MSQRRGAPRMWRKKRNGKEYGSYLTSIAGAEVNLGTADAELARERLPKAMKGARDFETDAAAAARATEPPVDELGGGEAAPAPQESAPVPAPSSPPAAALVPEVIPPSSEEEARAEAEATNAAAADGAPSNDNAGADQGVPGVNLPPDVVAQMLKDATVVIVLAQLDLQAWIIKKRFKKIAPQVDPASPAIDMAAQCWAAQFELWFPDLTKNVQPWMLAIALPALMFRSQLAASTPAPPEPGETQKPAETTAAPPVAVAA